MDNETHPFTPEGVDDQLRRLSTPSPFASQDSAPEAHLVQHLRTTYGAEQEVEQAVERVWQRLEQHGQLMRHASQESEARTSSIHPSGNERAISMQPRSKRKGWQITGALIAALLLIVLAASVISLVSKKQVSPVAGSSQISTSPTPTPTPSTVTSNKSLYVTDRIAVYKLDPVTGKVIWRYQAGKDLNTYNITYTIVEFHGAIFFADQSTALYAVDAQNGHLLWKIKGSSDDWLEHPMTDGNSLYVHSQKQGLCLVNTKEGKLQHCFPDLKPFLFSQGLFYGFSPGNADVHPTSIYAFDPAKATKLWEKQIPIQGQGFQEMNLTDGTLYVTSETIYDKANIPPLSSYIYAYNAQNGALLWKSGKVASDLILNPPAVDNGAVYFGSQDGRGGALSASDGHVLWTIQTNTGGANLPIGAIYPTPASANGVVYMGVITNNNSGQHDKSLIALNANHGTIIWQKFLLNYMGNQLLLDNGTIYTGTTDGVLYALSASNGSALWHTTLGTSPTEGFSSGQNTLLLAA